MTYHLPSYLPNAEIARTHRLASADGAEHRTYEFPGGGDAFWAVGDAHGAYDTFLWLPDGLHYFGLLYPDQDEVVYVWNVNPGGVALPQTIGPDGWTSGEMHQAFTRARTKAGAISAPLAMDTGTSVVTIVPEPLNGEPSLHLRYIVNGGAYEENMWFVDTIDVVKGPALTTKGMRRQTLLHARVVALDITYERWERRP